MQGEHIIVTKQLAADGRGCFLKKEGSAPVLSRRKCFCIRMKQSGKSGENPAQFRYRIGICLCHKKIQANSGTFAFVRTALTGAGIPASIAAQATGTCSGKAQQYDDPKSGYRSASFYGKGDAVFSAALRICSASFLQKQVSEPAFTSISAEGTVLTSIHLRE